MFSFVRGRLASSRVRLPIVSNTIASPLRQVRWQASGIPARKKHECGKREGGTRRIAAHPPLVPSARTHTLDPLYTRD